MPTTVDPSSYKHLRPVYRKSEPQVFQMPDTIQESCSDIPNTTGEVMKNLHDNFKAWKLPYWKFEPMHSVPLNNRDKLLQTQLESHVALESVPEYSSGMEKDKSEHKYEKWMEGEICRNKVLQSQESFCTATQSFL